MTEENTVYKLIGPVLVKQDQAEINKIIVEASKGSKFYEVGSLQAKCDRV